MSGQSAGRLWIGGTGRSGTTLLYRLLGAHPEVHAFEREMRFIVDPGGVFDLVHALTDSYSPARAREAWRAFRTLVIETLNSPRITPYADFSFAELLGADYARAVDDYLTSLLWGTYRGYDVHTRTPRLRHLASRVGRRLERLDALPRLRAQLLEARKTEQQAVRYFADRSDLMKRTGRFVDALFSAPALHKGKKTWCEKTPHNLLFADFLQELVPDSLFVHVLRDPRGVAESFSRQTWSSPDLRTSCRTVRDICERWFVVRERVDASRLIEIRLEDFATRALEQLNYIVTRGGLSAFEALPEPVSASRIDSWRDHTSGAALRILNDELGAVVERMGYAL